MRRIVAAVVLLVGCGCCSVVGFGLFSTRLCAQNQNQTVDGARLLLLAVVEMLSVRCLSLDWQNANVEAV